MAVHFGVIGAGGFAFNRSLPAFIQAPHFKLTALMDTSGENLSKASEKFNIPRDRCFTDLKKFLELDGLDAVVVSTPVHTHFDLVSRCMETGKHVLAEKPLGRTAKEAKKLVELAEKRGVKLGVGFHLRFHVLHQKAGELIRNGTFGNVNLIRMQNHLNYPETQGAWRQDPDLSGGGGPLIDVGSHHIDLMCYLLDSEVVEITALAVNQVHHYPVEDMSVILLRFGNGTLGMMDLSWNTPHRFNVFEVYGTRATLYCERTVGPFKDPYGRLLDGKSVEEIKLPYQDTYTLEAEAFARWVELDEPFLIPGPEGLKNNRLLEKVNEAVRTRRSVSV